MPAYRERIYICPGKNGLPAWIMDFPSWWDRLEFFKEYRDRQIDTGNPFYVDYGLLLTGSEAKAWDERCREAFAGSPQGLAPHIAEAMHTLESRLRTARWVIVESSEWESGLD